MRIGLFGGSFDPVHRGHLLLAECCWRQARLDRVEFVPTAQQPLKPRGPVASEADRVAMLRLAIADRREFALSLLEVERGGVSYTVDTLRQFRSERPDAELFFLMGADSLADFPTWREPAVICDLATPLVVRRAGSPPPDFNALAPLVTAERLAEIRALEVEMPATPISSSNIRQSIAEHGEWQALVPETVAAYISERGLYRS
ncbi:nicotinate-nucleotide adenylyltransferase [Lacipirellula limnantheis]|uniref:Probable nicotinate-nucleotide adenylyltransferase n=1 Tax=Lacipirellula limnantheis TaxID=2528024 RepID=A0A517TSD5_9BACT|nr:nicotinate-nucleotide adenylyltransferase [Lacipirellula limnantheis]QDT71285.1 Nicotinate-nucleotide adenylyltransferase [Lacipirellula limnantheis]